LKKKKKINKSGPNKLPGKYRQLLEFFRGNPRKTFNYKQITHKLGITNEDSKQDVIKILQVMEKEETIEAIERGSYRYVPDFSLFTG
jgi:ribonuclease R